jgi:hypothetical protein
MKRKALFLSLAMAAVLFIPGLAAPGAVPVQAQAAAPPPGTCCAVEFVKCARKCRCGVFEFNCTLDFPGCTPNCICNICP